MATENVQQNYELMVIFTPVLSEEDYKAEQKKFSDFITENGGTIVYSNPWGVRALAYPIAKKTSAIYWVLDYIAPTEVNAKLEVQMNRDENIMRHMITHLDKYAVEYNSKHRNKPNNYQDFVHINAPLPPAPERTPLPERTPYHPRPVAAEATPATQPSTVAAETEKTEANVTPATTTA